VFDLTGRYDIKFTAWYKYWLESGYDYVYVEYSTNGGTTWNTADPLYTFNGVQDEWTQVTVDVPQLANVAQAALRYHFTSDAGVVADGIYIDDVELTYTPIVCEPPIYQINLPIVLRQED
jgi:immune inhibitor A